MDLEIYSLLSKESQRAIKRVKKRFGRPYYYIPQARLVRRLAQQLQKSEEEIREQIAREREFLIEYKRYY